MQFTPFFQILAKNDNPNSADRVVNYLNRKGWTALSSACQKGKSDIVELLLDAGANPNVTAQEMFPIHYALKNEDNKWDCLLRSLRYIVVTVQAS